MDESCVWLTDAEADKGKFHLNVDFMSIMTEDLEIFLATKVIVFLL